MSLFFTTTSVFSVSKNQKVTVVGAGLAGLTTAYRLQQAGVDVDLYEARARVGGRVFTVSINGKTVELGGQGITDGGEATHIRRLIDEFGLKLNTSKVNLNQHYFNGEDLAAISQLFKNHQFDPEILKLQLDELASTCRNMKEILDQILKENDPLYQVIASRLAGYEGASIEKLSPVYAETLYHMLLGGLCSAHQENEVDIVSIDGGNAQLAEKMGDALGQRLHLNMPLKKVSKHQDGPFSLTFDGGHEVKTDLLVLAIPCSVYEKIIFEEESIPSEKLEQIQSVAYGTNAKIILPFTSHLSNDAGISNDHIFCVFDDSQTALTLFYTGETGLFSNETIDHAYDLAKPMVEKGFADACAADARPIVAEDQNFRDYQTPVGFSWPNDPYAGGSYSYISPGQESLMTSLSVEGGETFRTLFTPIDQKLYFAGEHTSILFDVSGTMEAACESGERIARAILKNLYSMTSASQSFSPTGRK